MGSVSESFSLLIIALLAISSLIMVKPAFAQTPTPTPQPIPTPYVPEFTINYVNSSYYVPESYVRNPITGQIVIDPYTGKDATNPPYYKNNSTVELIITNQPFVPYTDSSGNRINFFYNVRIKWLAPAPNETFSTPQDWVYIYSAQELPIASNSQYTVLNYPPARPTGIVEGFQVQAMIGSIQKDPNYPPSLNFSTFVGETSDWSNTQSLVMPDSNDYPIYTTPAATSTDSATALPSQSPSQTPTVPEFPIAIILPLFAVVMLLSIIIIRKKISESIFQFFNFSKSLKSA
jgi:hypothetical protein